MKSYLSLPFLVAACLGWISPALAAPVVTNLTASQRTGTKLVDIAYDVAAPGFAAVTGHASLANRGKLPDVLVGSATGGSALFALSYFDLTGNITAALLTGTYSTPEMDENTDAVAIRATITPNKKKLTKKKKGKKPKILKKTHVLSLRLTSTFDPAIEDAATISVQTK